MLNKPTTRLITLVNHRNDETTASIPTPKWHAPWRISIVVSSRLGWARSVALISVCQHHKAHPYQTDTLPAPLPINCFYCIAWSNIMIRRLFSPSSTRVLAQAVRQRSELHASNKQSSCRVSSHGMKSHSTNSSNWAAVHTFIWSIAQIHHSNHRETNSITQKQH